MACKQTNLAVAADVNTKAELLALADLVGPYICILKTHIDMIQDFDLDLITQLKSLAIQHNFLILEDRKFADIGSTVQSQYMGGIYQIAAWADLVTMHAICGDASIKSVAEFANCDPTNLRGVLLIGQLSCQDNLIDDCYTQQALEIAKHNKHLVVGMIAQQDLGAPDLIICTPGVSISQKKDALGQNYNSPEYVIKNCKTDIIIVGRAIYKAPNPELVAQEYRNVAWQAYLESL